MGVWEAWPGLLIVPWILAYSPSLLSLGAQAILLPANLDSLRTRQAGSSCPAVTEGTAEEEQNLMCLARGTFASEAGGGTTCSVEYRYPHRVLPVLSVSSMFRLYFPPCRRASRSDKFNLLPTSLFLFAPRPPLCFLLRNPARNNGGLRRKRERGHCRGSSLPGGAGGAERRRQRPGTLPTKGQPQPLPRGSRGTHPASRKDQPSSGMPRAEESGGDGRRGRRSTGVEAEVCAGGWAIWCGPDVAAPTQRRRSRM